MTTFVVSDLHLDATRPEIAEQFLRFLADEARGAAALYILGDLFESAIGDDDPDAHQALVKRALGALSASGVALYVMHGNRDFLLGSGFCRDTGATLLTDPTLVERHGRRALMTHGDALCIDDRPYQALRALVRDQSFQRHFLGLSLSRRQALAARARTGSKTHTATQPAMLMDVNLAAVDDLFRRSDVDLLIHGHTHRPAVHAVTVDGIPRTRIVTGDWYTQGSVLRWDDSGLYLEARHRSPTS